MSQHLLPLVESPPGRRRGRPPGARNKRSSDLARYVEATFGGMTPGQQAAELALVRPADLKKAKALAVHFGILEPEIPLLMLAMAVKARQLARAIGCDPKEAWLLLQKERAELLGYVHQKLPAASDPKGKALATVFLVPEGEAAEASQLADFSDEAELEFVGDLPADVEQVGRPKSDETA
ncbi:hypothetical protein [Phenylobacterium sp.]|uniref:hypothetical protein n=1 Tax=Phenylobacterium sp. TaxID=1871053 RepID=UPI002DE42B4B|nr:hypothetical protein [Phenylobacterium sp.]